jgi:hypothetical protein
MHDAQVGQGTMVESVHQRSCEKRTISLDVIGEINAFSRCIGLTGIIKLGHSVDVLLANHRDEQVDGYMYSSRCDNMVTTPFRQHSASRDPDSFSFAIRSADTPAHSPG